MYVLGNLEDGQVLERAFAGDRAEYQLVVVGGCSGCAGGCRWVCWCAGGCSGVL